MQMYIAFYILQLDFEDQFKQAVVDKCIVIFRFHNWSASHYLLMSYPLLLLLGRVDNF